MKEEFLHYIWQFKKFTTFQLQTVKAEPVTIINSGRYLQQSGPDFFNAQLRIGGQLWAGNVEIHVHSSDWYLHNHERDKAYDNVILHVVWEHDVDVMQQNNTELPVLELKHFVDADLIKRYELLATPKNWIYCETHLGSINSFVLENWKERLFFERLERKAIPIIEMAKNTNNDWEAILFCCLAKNFGLNTNGDVFYSIAVSMPFSVIRKISLEAEDLEALLFGRAGLLNTLYEDTYPKVLQQRYNYLCTKYKLQQVHINKPEFFRHRPDNFPTIRLSQLAQLYNKHQNLFSKIITADTIAKIYDVLIIAVSRYWQTHYQFDKESPKKRKALTKSFINLIIINTIIPFRFAYAKSTGKEITDELLQLLQQLSPEKNAVIEKFKQYKMPVNSAYDTQALLQLKNEYCNNKRCMQCGIGTELLKT